MKVVITLKKNNVTKNKVLVSIAIRAYNTEKYIRECLDSVINQNVDSFNIEIVISTDCSTDHTQSIVNEYKKKYGNLIKDVTPKSNLGGYDSLFYVISKCNGKYIALCDGDDYWIDNNKLAKQINFLENNPSYSATFHNSNILYEIKSKKVYGSQVRNKDYNANEIVKKWIVPTSSFVFRAKFKNKLPPKDKFYYDDIVVFLTLEQYGKIRGFSDNMSVYRKSEQSWTSNMEKSKKIYDIIYMHICTLNAYFKNISKKTIFVLKLKNRILKILFILRKYINHFK